MSMLQLLPADRARQRQRALRRRRAARRLPVARDAECAGARSSFVFQEPMTSLNPVLTIGHQIGEVLASTLDLSRADARARVELLDQVRIRPRAKSGRVSAPAVGRHEAAGDDRHGDRPDPSADRRRADDRARRDDPGGILDAPARPPRPARDGDDPDHARPRRGRRHRRPRRVMYEGPLVEAAPSHEVFTEPQHPYTIGHDRLDPAQRPGGTTRQATGVPGRVPSLSEPPG